MRLSYLTLSICSLASLAAAQEVEVTGKTLSPFAAVSTIGTNTTWDGVAKDTNFAVRRGISVSTRQNPTGMWASGYASISVSQYVPMITISQRSACRGGTNDGGGSSDSPSATNAKRGPQVVLGNYTGKPNEKGILILSFRCNVQYGGPPSFNSASIDIGNDNSIEWQIKTAGQDGLSREFPVVFDNTGNLQVKFTTQASCYGTGDLRDWINCYQDLSLQFRSADWGKCAVTSYGKGCGPKLEAGVSRIGNNNVVAWKLTGGFKNSFAVNVVGTQALDLQLGAGCSLLSNAIVLTIVQTDANGEWKDSDVLPLRNLRTYHQMLPLDVRGNNLVITATNGQNLVCTGF